MAKNHYFSDITELFLKAKEEENIEPNPHTKATVREMLVYKINEMKAAPAPRENFFNKWKFQLIGVPASLFGLVLIVFAATNLKFTIPKEDFTPTTEKAPAQEVEMIIEKPQQEPEKDRPIVKTAVKPDLSETPSRTLKKLPVVSTRGGEEVVVEEPVEETTVKTVFKPKIEEPTLTTPILIITPEEPEESLDQDIPTEPVVEEPAIEEEPIEIPTKPILIDPPKIDTPEPLLAEPITTPPITTAPLAEKALVVDYTENAQEFVEKVEMQEETYDVFYYRDSELLKEPIFDKEQIIKLTGASDPSAVNVYYTEEKQVVVEVKENGTSKWYLFANVNDIWTIQKYEKQTLRNVVK